MSSSPDPQTWVFPPLGAAVLPSDPSAAFGPISQGDKIKLEWAPASSTPEIAFICANDGTTFVASENNPSPYTYTFSQTINNGSSHMCWFFFPGTSLGNTLTFTYDNQGTGSSVLWEQDSQLAQALSGSNPTTVTSTLTVTKTEKSTAAGTATGSAAGQVITLTLTETITQTPSTLLTTVSNPSTTFVSTSVELLAQHTDTASASDSTTNVSATQASGLSAGAAAGITAAAIIAIFLLLLLGRIFYNRGKRRSTREGGVSGMSGAGLGAGPGVDVGPVVMPSTYKYQPPAMEQQQQQQQSLMHGYYPASPRGQRGTVHEMAN